MVKSNIKTIISLYGIDEIARRSSVSVQTLYTYIKQGFASIPRHKKLAEIDPLFTVEKFEDDVKKNMASHALRSYKK